MVAAYAALVTAETAVVKQISVMKRKRRQAPGARIPIPTFYGNEEAKFRRSETFITIFQFC
jgi:hypothetical protein